MLDIERNFIEEFKDIVSNKFVFVVIYILDYGNI